MFIKKKPIDRLLNRKFLTLAGLVIIFAISYPLSKNINQQYKINSEIKDLQNEINNLQSDNDDLSKLIKFLESDQFVDRQARLNLNLKKVGEEVTVIKNMDAMAASDSTAGGNNGSDSMVDSLKSKPELSGWLKNLYSLLAYFNR